MGLDFCLGGATNWGLPFKSPGQTGIGIGIMVGVGTGIFQVSGFCAVTERTLPYTRRLD